MSILFAPTISDDSWLNDPGYTEDETDIPLFREALKYASTQTHFIASAGGITAEQAYYIWSCLNDGVKRIENRKPLCPACTLEIINNICGCPSGHPPEDQ